MRDIHIVTFMKLLTFRWYGHSERLNNERIPKNSACKKENYREKKTWKRDSD